MVKDIARSLGLGVAFSAVLLIVLPSPGGAQLAQVAWSEALSFTTNLGQENHGGLDPSLPEPQSGTLSGAGYSLSGSISFASPGPPNTTASINGSYQSGLTYLSGLSYCRIDFQFQVVQTAAPPVAVSTVPVNIQAQGTADADGAAAFFATSSASFNLSTPAGPLLAWQASYNHPPYSFNNNQQVNLTPGVVVSGDMTADASIAAEGPLSGTSASASAMVDPVIGVADQVIPGTAANYRSYFKVEFAPGYDALGSAPTRNATWGKIKQLYGN